MAKQRYIRTFKVDGDNVNTLEASIYYSLGGFNYFTYKNEPRGYYFSLTPFKDDGVWRSYTAFSGSKMCVLECNRQSAKRFETAKAMMDGLLDEHLDRFCDANGIKLIA